MKEIIKMKRITPDEAISLQKQGCLKKFLLTNNFDNQFINCDSFDIFSNKPCYINVDENEKYPFVLLFVDSYKYCYIPTERGD